MVGNKRKFNGMSTVRIQEFKETQRKRMEIMKKGTAVMGSTSTSAEQTKNFPMANHTAINSYVNYTPHKPKHSKNHPHAALELHELSTVNPYDIDYELKIPRRTVQTGRLTDLELESILLVSSAHQRFLHGGSRTGFLIGDSVKSRSVGGIIFENWLNGRKKTILISALANSKTKVEEDLWHIGAPDIDIHSLNKLKYGKIDSKSNGYKREGVVHCTYESLVGSTTANGMITKYNSRLKQIVNWCGESFDGLIIFADCHKASLIASGEAELSKMGQAVIELQSKLPLARVLYISATGVSEPRNMAYMVRLGLWGPSTPFLKFPQFLQAVEKRGVSAMKIVEMDMKLRGIYIARQSSFNGATIQIKEVPFTDDITRAYNDSVKLWAEAKDLFEETSPLLVDNHKLRRSMWRQFWAAHKRYFKHLCIASKVPQAVELTKQAIKNGKSVIIRLESTGESQTLEAIEDVDGELEDFISDAKSIFERLLEMQFPAPNRCFVDGVNGSKTEGTQNDKLPNQTKKRERSSSAESIETNSRHLRKKAKKQGESDIDLSGSASDSDSNSESSSSSDSELFFFDDNASDSGSESESDIEMFCSSVHCPFPSKKNKTMQDEIAEQVQKLLADGNQQSNEALMVKCQRACDMRDGLHKKINDLGKRLPTNTLDYLIEELGGPQQVAEITYRKGRVVRSNNGEMEYESRSQDGLTLESVNIEENERFKNGSKMIAIISESASNDVQMQSNRRGDNQRRRINIMLELPWSTDCAIEQFGRSHLSDHPEIVISNADMDSEILYSSEHILLVSKLGGESYFASSVSKQLEALGANIQNDCITKTSREFIIHTMHTQKALRSTLDFIYKNHTATLNEVMAQINASMHSIGIESPEISISLSEFLNRIRGLSADSQCYLVDHLMTSFDTSQPNAEEIADLGTMENVERIEDVRFVTTGNLPIEVNSFLVDTGMTFEEASKISVDMTHDAEGFYQTDYPGQDNQSVFLATLLEREDDTEKLESKSWKKFTASLKTHHPNTGTQIHPRFYGDIIRNSKKISKEQAEGLWNDRYDSNTCDHLFWDDHCDYENCRFGSRRQPYTVLSGSVFSYWPRIEYIIRKKHNARIQMVCLNCDDSSTVTGILLESKIIQNDIMADLQKKFTRSI